MKLKSFGMNSHPKRYENTLIEGMKLHSKGMKWCRRYEKIPIIPRYETDAQGMKDSTRYEKCAQGIQQVHKGMKCFFRNETRVFSWCQTLCFSEYSNLERSFFAIRSHQFVWVLNVRNGRIFVNYCCFVVGITTRMTNCLSVPLLDSTHALAFIGNHLCSTITSARLAHCRKILEICRTVLVISCELFDWLYLPHLLCSNGCVLSV